MTPIRMPDAPLRPTLPKLSPARRFVQTSLALSITSLAFLSHASAATWDSVPLGGGGYATGIVSNANASAIYIRTDVGGVFRWVPAADANNGSWKPLSDDQVPFGTPGAEGVMGIESIATDPNNLNRLYTAAADALWVSEDKGDTWDVIPNSPVVNTEANGQFRWCGERLAVDPNNSNILWFGSREAGLQKGVKKSDGSWVWTVVPATNLPWGQIVVTSPPRSKGGIMFVAADKNGSSTILYAGVHDTVGSTGGVYRSTDGGVNWTKLSVSTGTTLYSRRAQVASDGALYVTAGTDGVYKVTRTGTTLNKLTTLPVNEYSGIATDPQNSQIVYVVNAAAAGVWRSVDGGASWLSQTSSFGARQEPDGTLAVTGYWFGQTAALMVNPTNSNELWGADYFGAFRTRSASNIGTTTPPAWNTLQKNQEETVVLTLKNAPTGPKLVTGVADVGGYRYDDTTARPYGAAGNRFNDPVGGNFTSIDFSESNPNVWAASWVNPSGPAYGGTGSFSIDGGVTWQAFGKVAQTSVAAGAANTWLELDVAPYLRQHLGGPITLILRNSIETGGGLTFQSREGANPPRLVINGGTTVLASADAIVRDGTYGAVNDGTGTALFTKTTSSASYTRWSYLKFDLTGVSAVTSGKLRIYLTTADTVATPLAVYANDVTSWTETGLTWNTRPLFNGLTNVYLSTPPAPLLVSGGGRIAVSATNPDNFVWLPIGTSNPAYYTKDRGVTWAASTGGPNSPISGVYTNGTTSGYTALPLTSDRVNGNFYITRFSAWDAATSSTKHLTYKSTDGGQTWVATGNIANGSFNARTPQFVASPVAQDLWFADDGSYSSFGGGLWRSTDGGSNWSKVTTAGKVQAISFGKANAGSGYAYATYIYGEVGSVSGVYRSDNVGGSWVKLADPTIAGSPVIAGDRQNAGGVFVGPGGRGIFRYNSGNPTLTPTADAFVRDGAAATTNAGTDPTLMVKLDGGGYTRWSYVKFDITSFSGTVTSAKLRLTVTSAPASATPVAVFASATTTWVEGNGGTDNTPLNELIWNNKPATTGAALATATVPASAAVGTVLEWELASYIAAQKTAGATSVTLVLQGTVLGSPYGVGFGSRESATAPELKLVVGP